MQIDTYLENDLMVSLDIYRGSSPDGNQTIKRDFDDVQHLVKIKMSLSFFIQLFNWFVIVFWWIANSD